MKKNENIANKIVKVLEYAETLKKDDSLNKVEKMVKVLDMVEQNGMCLGISDSPILRETMLSLLVMISDDFGLTEKERKKACILQITSRLGDLSKIIKKQVEEADDVDFGLINNDDSAEDEDEDEDEDEGEKVSVKTVVHEITFDKDGEPIDKIKPLSHIPRQIRDRIIELLKEPEKSEE